MKAAVIQAKNQMTIQDIAVPDVIAGSILLRVLSCTVCGSDLRILESGNSRVKYPAVIGHEIAGEIVEVGKGAGNYKAGDRIALGADIPCGKCSWCLNGLGNCCEENLAIGYQFPGGFAEYCRLDPVVVKHGPIAAIPKDFSPEAASLAEPLACCINGLERVSFKPGQSVLIIGAGPIGIMLAKLSRAFGAPQIILADTDSRRLQQATLAGADHALTVNGADAFITQVKDLTQGRGTDVVLVACASVDAQELALRAVAKRGCVNFFGGLPADARPMQLISNVLHYREVAVTGSHGSTPVQHALAVQLITSKRVDVAGLVTHRFPLSQIDRAFAAARERAGLKVAVTPS